MGKYVQGQDSYHRTQMQKEMVIQKLREKGCRITKQRLMLLDIILEENCSCCKEIYYRAMKKDANIGTATVYRMINTLEEIGAIDRRNMYKVNCETVCDYCNQWVIEYEDGTSCYLSGKNWYQIFMTGLERCGYLDNQKVTAITMIKE